MLQNAYYVKKGPILARFSALRDAVEFATAITIPEVDGRETDNRVKFKARLPDNLLCYILAISNVVRTKGFPLELSQGLSFETRAKLFSSKLKRDRWFLLASILRSDLRTIEDLVNALDELESVLHDGVPPHKIRLAITREEFESRFKPYISEFNFTWEKYLEEKKKNLSRKTLQILKSAVLECYRRFYQTYWKSRSRTLRYLICSLLEDAVAVLAPLKRLEALLNAKFTEPFLEVYPIDVFRTGGERYGVYPNRITCRSDPSVALEIYIDVAHEAAHLLVKGWEAKFCDLVSEIALSVNCSSRIQNLLYTIEEHIVAVIQHKVDLLYYGAKRRTHPYMFSTAFILGEKAWREVEETYYLFKLDEFIKLYLEKLKASQKAIEQLRKEIQLFYSQETPRSLQHIY